MTDKYDPTDPKHERLKKDIEEGNGLPAIITCAECLKAMKDTGLEIVTAYSI
jgi:sterol 24-C-methyltransferase